jgi:hypothetical protein
MLRLLLTDPDLMVLFILALFGLAVGLGVALGILWLHA